MIHKFFRLSWVPALLTLLVTSCGTDLNVFDVDPDDLAGNGTGATACDTVSSAFAVNVVPIFTSRSCANTGCHGGGSASGGLALDGSTSAIYSSALDRVNTESPAESKLLRKGLGLDDHGGSNLLVSTASSEYQTILCWIERGAPND